MRVKSTLIATVIAFVAIVGLISSVNALEPSLWTSGGEIKKQLLIKLPGQLKRFPTDILLKLAGIKQI